MTLSITMIDWFINKCLKYEDEIKEVKEDNKKLAKQIEDLKKEAKDMLLYP